MFQSDSHWVWTLHGGEKPEEYRFFHWNCSEHNEGETLRSGQNFNENDQRKAVEDNGAMIPFQEGRVAR